MKILAIDTTEQACSAALLLDGEVLEKFEVVPRRHSQWLLPMIESLLGQAELTLGQLDALAFGRGPGSFTGVRIATAVAQGLAMAADLPVVPVSSLLALAQGVARAGEAAHILAAFDARMHEVYWLTCRVAASGLVEPLGEPRIGSPGEVKLSPEADWLLAGSGVAAYGELLAAGLPAETARRPQAQVHAGDVARLAVPRFLAGETVSAPAAQPLYLRQQVARKMGDR